jgi:hypothetical protein
MSHPPTDSAPSVELHLSRRRLVLLSCILLGPWVFLAAYLTGWIDRAKVPSFQLAPSGKDPSIIHCKPGPLGDLEYVRILTEPPEQNMSPNFPMVEYAVWFFRDYSRSQLDELWRQAGLNAAELALINQPANWETEDTITRIKAPKELVFGLNPTAREVIYSALSVFSENSSQHEPFRFRAQTEDEWFRNSGLKPETIAAVKKLLYRRGTSVLFSDQRLFLPTIPSQDERTRLLKTLARKSTMIVKLRISPDSDIDELENYWGGVSSKDIGALLRSLSRNQSSVTIDIIHLLPRFARARLYNYPLPSDPGSDSYMDCHWSVLNFFKTVPDPRYENIDEVARAFINNYHPVTGRPKYGDIYLFTLPNGDVLHSCVYIADDIVFTKNGATPSAPWILMSLDDVIAFYPSNQPLDIQRYRPKAILPD